MLTDIQMGVIVVLERTTITLLHDKNAAKEERKWYAYR